MRGFLSKFLAKRAKDSSSNETRRSYPKFSEKFSTSDRESAQNSTEVNYDPDDTFLTSDEFCNEESQTPIPEVIANQDVLAEKNTNNFHNKQLTETEGLESTSLFEPESGFINDWLNFVEKSQVLNTETTQYTRDGNENNYIHYAAAFGDLQFLEELILKGWSINKLNKFKKTPYDFSVKFGNLVNAYFLRKALRESGHSIYRSDLVLKKDEFLFEPKQGFIREWLKVIQDKKIIQQFDAQKRFDNKGNFYIHYAAAFGSTKLLQSLIERGWPSTKQNKSGKTPLDFAIYYCNIDNQRLFENIMGLQKNPEQQEILPQNFHITEAEKFLQTDGSNQENIDDILSDYTQTVKSDKKDFVAVELDQKASPTDGQGKEIFSKDNANFTCIACGQSFEHIDDEITISFCPACGVQQIHKSDGQVGSSTVPVPGKDQFYESVSLKDEGDALELKISKDIPDKIVEPFADTKSYKSEKRNKNLDEYDKVSRLGRIEEEQEIFSNSSANEFEDKFVSRESHLDLKSNKSQHIDNSNTPDEDFSLNLDILNDQPEEDDQKGISDDLFETLFGNAPHISRNDNAPFEVDDEPSMKLEQVNDTPKEFEDWEIFLDEDLEEQSQNTQEYYEDEDPLEIGLINDYAQRLAVKLGGYSAKDRKRTYKFFLNIFGDFPYYQSYAAIERLVYQGHQVDQISNAYEIKILWSENPSIWSERYFNKMERSWNISRNPKMKNSMSWQMACDLTGNYPPTELENLILVDWYKEWLNLSLININAKSGWEPAFNLYASYLHQKRKENPFNLIPR